jgi:hypothetical protein
MYDFKLIKTWFTKKKKKKKKRYASLIYLFITESVSRTGATASGVLITGLYTAHNKTIFKKKSLDVHQKQGSHTPQDDLPTSYYQPYLQVDQVDI